MSSPSLDSQSSLRHLESVAASRPDPSRPESRRARVAYSERHYRWRKIKSGFMQVLALICAFLVLAALGLILVHLLKPGFTSLNWAFFTHLPKPVGAAEWPMRLLGLSSCSG